MGMNESESPNGPLQGLRVLDISRFIAGPFAGQILGQLGAEVVKVEEPGSGDPMRHLSKYSTKTGSAHFLSGNACKKSLTLNLRAEEGREVFRRLLEDCDILVENFRPGVMARLGLPYDELLERYPKLIIATVSGFGQSGPWKDRAAYDLIAQAAGGGMSLTGWPGDQPVKMGIPIGDVGGSLYAVIGILAALNKRHESGKGELVDISMMDVQLSLLNYHAHYYWLSGESPQPEGDSHPNIVPYQAFETADRPVVVAVYGDPFWPGFCRAANLESLSEDGRFATNELRRTNKVALLDILSPHFKTRSQTYWLDRLIDEGVPVGPLNNVGEALESEQALARNMIVTAGTASGEEIRLLGTPVKLRSGAVAVTAPPSLGEHSEEVLVDWGGYPRDYIEKLRDNGTI